MLSEGSVYKADDMQVMKEKVEEARRKERKYQGNLRLCKYYITISLINHPSKIMLRVIWNKLERKAEQILTEEQAGFRPGRSTTMQTFNVRLIIKKHLLNLYGHSWLKCFQDVHGVRYRWRHLLAMWRAK